MRPGNTGDDRSISTLTHIEGHDAEQDRLLEERLRWIGMDRRSFMKLIGAALTAPAIGSILAACGGDDADDEGSEDSEGEAGVPTSTAASNSPAPTGAASTESPVSNVPSATGVAVSTGVSQPGPTSTPRQHQPGVLATDHPRLLIRSEDVPRLREWAVDSNPIWVEALLPTTEQAKQYMDEGLIETDEGGVDWTEYPTEGIAQLFAFMSLVHPDDAERADYAERARTLLMVVMNEAVKGAAEGEPFRDPYFSVFNRSRWWGESFPLVVDWIYPSLSAEDKMTIRTVFLRWIEENMTATVTGEYNHPQPVGVVNDPVLTSNPYLNRWAINNYFTAHMRNTGLMALCSFLRAAIRSRLLFQTHDSRADPTTWLSLHEAGLRA